jgi:hypothetical protein
MTGGGNGAEGNGTGPRDPTGGRILRFPPASRRWPRPTAEARNLGLTPLSKALGPTSSEPKGHWCDRCQGVWYSHFGEARCPVCGGRGLRRAGRMCASRKPGLKFEGCFRLSAPAVAVDRDLTSASHGSASHPLVHSPSGTVQVANAI